MQRLLFILALVCGLAPVGFLACAQRAEERGQTADPFALLRESAVTSDDFVRVELFTWAMESPRAGEPFLRDTASSGGPYQRALERVATGDSEEASLARLLATDAVVRRRRFAWTTPMGTAIPLGTRSYGPVLIRLVLEEDAFFLHFTPEQTPSFRALDRAGREVALSAVLADPAHIASVFHEQASVPMREFVVHGRVVTVETNTEAIRERLRRETEMLAAMRVWSRTHDEGRQPMATHWAARLPSDATPFALFAACMPFDTTRHRPTPTALRNLSLALSRRADVGERRQRAGRSAGE